MDLRKIIGAAFFSLGVVVLVSLLWKQALFLSLTLILLAIFKHYVAPIKNEFAWFCVIAVWGTVSETLIMKFGGRPWVYAEPIFLDIAVWTPLLWGIAATIFITLYQGVFGSK